MQLKNYCGKLTVMHRIRHYLLVVTQITGLCSTTIYNKGSENTHAHVRSYAAHAKNLNLFPFLSSCQETK